MKNKKKSIYIALRTLIAAAILLVSVALIIGSSVVNGKKYSDFYNSKSLDIAEMVSHTIDPEYVTNLIREMGDGSFAQARMDADEQENGAPIDEWLRERDLYDKYYETHAYMEKVCNDMDIQYLYIQIIENGKSVFLFDASDSAYCLGASEVLSGQFLKLTGNQRLEPTTSHSEFGWLSSAGEPLVNSAGEKVAVVFVDIDVTDIAGNVIWFFAAMILISVLAAVIIGFLASLSMKKRISTPLEELTSEANRFASSEDGYKKENITSLDIHTGDEIEELYLATRHMQISLIEYMENFKKVTAEKERISAELNVATQIQADMLPRVFPPFPGRNDFDIYATMNPAKEVGGDFYDFFFVDDDHFAMVMADVSGKGVPAALFMVIAKTLIKNRALMGGTPGEILYDVNNQLMEGNEAELFVTVWLAIIEISTGKGISTNAGHEHPALKRKDGRFEAVKYKHSPAVATIEGIKFREHEFEMQPGDTLFVFTDGLPEATSADVELYGEDRLIEALNKNTDVSLEQLLVNMRADVDAFVGDAPQFDDLTMMAFHLNEK